MPVPSFLLDSCPALTRRTLLGAAGAVLLPGCAAPAQAAGGRVGLEIVDRETGRVLPVWRHRGERWIAGRPGARYAIRLTNHGSERVLVVAAVDGVNVVSGQSAAWHQTGYVLAPWQRYDVSGWRKSDREVAAFEFTALPDSYAARTGRPLDVGVIGIAVFRERPAPVVAAPPALRDEPAERRADAAGSAAPRSAPAPAAAEADGARDKALAQREESARSRLGTGHGAREHDEVRRTAFERASDTPDETIAIRYDRVENLVAAGVIPPERHVVRPRPFPGSDGYVPDPPAR